MENNKDYVIDSGFIGNKLRDHTDVNYSTPGGLQCINHIFETSNKYDCQDSLFDPWIVHPTLESNNKQIDREHRLMEPLQKKPPLLKS